MYKLLREILSELKSLNEKLQVIESDKEQKYVKQQGGGGIISERGNHKPLMFEVSKLTPKKKANLSEIKL